jgi:Tol biopolymer transport system component/serine/threonine protein kinase
MTPERYQQIGKLYHSVLELDADVRPMFLAQACDGDEELLREVQSLIASHEQAGSFIESPALEVAAEIIAADSYGDMEGRQLSHYEIKSLLGAGGMGEVYLAQDTRLDRQVALKLLPGAFINDVDRVRRFEQEARAASALNHPHILTIYEIERAEDKHFIVMEYIDGETLREKIHRKRTPLSKLLKCLQQVAEGLAKAHAAGIVHRDLKPDNIMVTRDGYAKVLDFGLAKLMEQPKPAGAGDATSSAAAATSLMPQHSLPGMVRGTVGYMSPEQAQGKVKEIDQRSDIFSFGCILFEAATGRKAFEGKDALESLYKIVHAPTPQIKETNRDAPDELQRIVRRCLAKDPERRYQSIKDVAIELEELQQELKAEPEPRHSAQLVSSPGTTPSGDARAGALSVSQPAVSIAEVGGSRPTTSAEYIVNEIERHKTGASLLIAALVVAIAGITYGLYKFAGHKPATSLPLMKITRLTNSGKVTGLEARFASISPDGKYVAYAARDDSGQSSLWVTHVATTSNVQIVPPAGADVEFAAPAFSPDSNYVCYIRTEKNGAAVLYQVPVLGGTSKKLLDGMRVAPISFSPDGKRFTFIRRLEEEDELMVANADGKGEQSLATRKHPDYFLQSAAWSPDGKTIACAVGGLPGKLDKSVAVIQVADGTQKPLTSHGWANVERVAWLSDGSGVITTAQEMPEGLHQIWQISYPEGEAHQLTNDLNDYHNASLTADSSALVTVLTDFTSNIWVAPTGEWNNARQLTSGKIIGGRSGGITWTPDGRIVYRSLAGGNPDIWIMDADGRNQKQLTDDVYVERSLSVTGDGRYIVFDSARTGSVQIWRVDIDGSNLKQLTTGIGASWPQVSPDGKWVAYTSFGSSGFNIWKVSIDGGQPVLITDKFASQPAVSPDGKLIACYSRDQRTRAVNIALLPFEGGDPVKLFDLPPPVRLYDAVSWTPDGRALTYVNGRGIVSNIWLQPVDGGQPRQLIDFHTDRIFSFSWSRDGKWLAISRGVVNNDVVLISNFR